MRLEAEEVDRLSCPARLPGQMAPLRPKEKTPLVMKILDIPQSGKRGITVSQGGRFGLISRTLVIPTNPRTADQMLVRNHLSGIAAGWRGLTQEQPNAWTESAKQVSSASRLGKSGPLTGSQFYAKINMALMAGKGLSFPSRGAYDAGG
jgi:hypothetical protein